MSEDFRARLVESYRSLRERDLMARDEVRQLVHYEDTQRHRQFTAICLGRFDVSIQASTTHYCEPRLTHDDLTRYLTWEMAIFDRGGAWVCGESFRALNPPADLADLFDNDQVAGYVPTARVQAIVEFLESIDGPEVIACP